MRLFSESGTDEQYVEAVRKWLADPLHSFRRHIRIFLVLFPVSVLFPMLAALGLGRILSPEDTFTLLDSATGGFQLSALGFCVFALIRFRGGLRMDRLLVRYHDQLEEELGDKAKIAATLGQIGGVKQKQKNYRDAIGAFATAASLFKELESPNFELAIKYLASVRGEIGEEKFNRIIKELQKKGE